MISQFVLKWQTKGRTKERDTIKKNIIRNTNKSLCRVASKWKKRGLDLDAPPSWRQRRLSFGLCFRFEHNLCLACSRSFLTIVFHLPCVIVYFSLYMCKHNTHMYTAWGRIVLKRCAKQYSFRVIYMRQNCSNNLWFKHVACKQITTCIGSSLLSAICFKCRKKTDFLFVSILPFWSVLLCAGLCMCMCIFVQKIFRKDFFYSRILLVPNWKLYAYTVTRIKCWCSARFSVGSMSSACTCFRLLDWRWCRTHCILRHITQTIHIEDYGCR